MDADVKRKFAKSVKILYLFQVNQREDEAERTFKIRSKSQKEKFKITRRQKENSKFLIYTRTNAYTVTKPMQNNVVNVNRIENP